MFINFDEGLQRLWRRCFVTWIYTFVALAKSLFLLLRCCASKFRVAFLFIFYSLVTRRNTLYGCDKCACVVWHLTQHNNKQEKNAKRWKALKRNVRSKHSKHWQQWMNIWTWSDAMSSGDADDTVERKNMLTIICCVSVIDAVSVCFLISHCPLCLSNGIT